jgi:organic radical activating enzyme
MNLSLWQKNIVRTIRKWYLEVKVKIFGNSFYCAALNGESNYNISVNSDMTVSCNCQDYDGSGIIGSLNSSSLAKIFSGDKAIMFRESLATGKLPNLTCARCSELKVVDKAIAERKKTSWKVPKEGIMVENTSACNLNCIACDRGVIRNTRKSSCIGLKDMEKISNEIKKNGIKTVSFFNLGEPFLSNNIYRELEILKKENPDLFICLSTNGMALNSEEKRKAVAKFVGLVEFSIDGVDNKSVRKYQRGADFEVMYKNMKDLVEYRNKWRHKSVEIVWKYVLFNWNDSKEQIEKAIRMAKLAGVDALYVCPSTNPFWGISWRYYFGKQIRSLGKMKHDGVWI